MSCIGCVPTSENEKQTPSKGVLGDAQVNILCFCINVLKFIAHCSSRCFAVLSILGLLLFLLFFLLLWCFSVSENCYIEDSIG